MNARQRYAELPQSMRRSAARNVRKAFGTDSRTRMRIDVWAELALEGLIYNGQVDAYWLYCWELGTRLNSVRQVANVAAGAR